MKTVLRMVFAGLVPALAACVLARARTPEPLSIEFGQDRFLSDAYLAATPGARCGHHPLAPAVVEAGAPLPDGSWFRIVAVNAASEELGTVYLERGVETGQPQLTMRLDSEEGIVRLDDAGRKDAWGINSGWAGWLRALGRRAQALDCAAFE